MRPMNCFRLLLACLLVAAVRTPFAAASHSPRHVLTNAVIEQEFQGRGLTLKDAEARALECACDWLAVNSGLEWTPTPEFLREKHMVQFGEPMEKEFEVAKDFGGRLQVVTMRLRISSDQARACQKQARQDHMVSRHLLTARILGGLLCLLVVVGGYLRLEDATKGYYTRLLRITALVVLLSAGVGLYLIG